MKEIQKKIAKINREIEAISIINDAVKRGVTLIVSPLLLEKIKQGVWYELNKGFSMFRMPDIENKFVIYTKQFSNNPFPFHKSTLKKTVLVVAGKVRVQEKEGSIYFLNKGEIITIDEDTTHLIVALENSEIINIYH